MNMNRGITSKDDAYISLYRILSGLLVSFSGPHRYTIRVTTCTMARTRYTANRMFSHICATKNTVNANRARSVIAISQIPERRSLILMISFSPHVSAAAVPDAAA